MPTHARLVDHARRHRAPAPVRHPGVQPAGPAPEPGRERLVGDRRPAAAPVRPDPEPDRERQGLRHARAGAVRAGDAGPHQGHRGGPGAGSGPGRDRDHQEPGPPAGRGGGLSAASGKRELPGVAGGADRDREQDRLRSAVLQRPGDAAEHADRAVPLADRGPSGPVPAAGVLRGRRGLPRRRGRRPVTRVRADLAQQVALGLSDHRRPGARRGDRLPVWVPVPGGAVRAGAGARDRRGRLVVLLHVRGQAGAPGEPEQAPNAFATGRNPEHASIAVTEGLLQTLNRVELEGVIGHELSHVKDRDILVGTLTATLVGVVVLLAGWMRWGLFWGGGRGRDRGGGGGNAIFLVLALVAMILAPLAAQLIRFAVSRRREYLADADGALLTRYPPGLAAALRKIAASSNT